MTVFLRAAVGFTATGFRTAFFGAFFLEVVFLAACFFGGFRFLGEDFFALLGFFLFFFLAAIGAVYHRHGLLVV